MLHRILQGCCLENYSLDYGHSVLFRSSTVKGFSENIDYSRPISFKIHACNILTCFSRFDFFISLPKWNFSQTVGLKPFGALSKSSEMNNRWLNRKILFHTDPFSIPSFRETSRKLILMKILTIFRTIFGCWPIVDVFAQFCSNCVQITISQPC